MTETAEKTLTDILAVVAGANQQIEAAESEISHARGRECAALNDINQAAKQTVDLLLEMPDQFIKAFDEKWNSNNLVKTIRPRKGVSEP